MKKWRIEYREEFEPSPLSFWVHKHLDGDSWPDATKYEPRLPGAVPAKGYPVLIVTFSGVELRFSSLEEVEHFIDVIRQKNMPTSMQLAAKRDTSYGPNGHWLSRLPAKLKSWKNREKVIPVIQEGLLGLNNVYKKIPANK